MEISTVYFTAEDRESALKIARTLVNERLVACANVIDGVTSVYRWNDQLQEDGEVVVLAKTRLSNVTAVIRRATELHDYDCPCVVSWRISETSDAYRDWVLSETPSLPAASLPLSAVTESGKTDPSQPTSP